MTKHRSLSRGDVLPASFLAAQQEFISTLAANFTVGIATATSLQVVAGADNAQAAVGINGRWRYNSATVTAAHPGGAAGTYDVYVTASDNSFSDSPLPDTDSTNYAFGLVIRTAGSPPATALWRKVANVVWSGSAITSVENLTGSPPTGPAGGDLSGTYPYPQVAKASGDFTIGTGFNRRTITRAVPASGSAVQIATINANSGTVRIRVTDSRSGLSELFEIDQRASVTGGAFQKVTASELTDASARLAAELQVSVAGVQPNTVATYRLRSSDGTAGTFTIDIEVNGTPPVVDTAASTVTAGVALATVPYAGAKIRRGLMKTLTYTNDGQTYSFPFLWSNYSAAGDLDLLVTPTNFYSQAGGGVLFQPGHYSVTMAGTVYNANNAMVFLQSHLYNSDGSAVIPGAGKTARVAVFGGNYLTNVFAQNFVVPRGETRTVTYLFASSSANGSQIASNSIEVEGKAMSVVRHGDS